MRFMKRSKQTEDVSLQITSMADIFIILLVFLLKSYSAGTITISPSKDTQLPTAAANDKAAEALKVEISEGAVLVEGKPVATIHGFRFANGDLGENGVSRSLVQAFEQERAKTAGGPAPASQGDGESDSSAAPKLADPRVVILADQRAPYATIKTVLASAATQGYTDIKLAVIHEE